MACIILSPAVPRPLMMNDDGLDRANIIYNTPYAHRGEKRPWRIKASRRPPCFQQREALLIRKQATYIINRRSNMWQHILCTFFSEAGKSINSHAEGPRDCCILCYDIVCTPPHLQEKMTCFGVPHIRYSLLLARDVSRAQRDARTQTQFLLCCCI
jgi:hypothetical protein